MRTHSHNAPEASTGNVERVPTMKHANPGTSGEEVVSPMSPDAGYKKQGTFSKLFKRKPVGGPSEGAGVEGDRKKYY